MDKNQDRRDAAINKVDMPKKKFAAPKLTRHASLPNITFTHSTGGSFHL